MAVMGVWAQQLHPDRILYVKNIQNLEAIEGVAVKLVKENQEVIFTDTTNEKGLIQLDYLPQSLELWVEFRHSLYETESISFEKLRQTNFEVFLSPNSFSLDEVVFTSSKFRSKRNEVAQSISVLKKSDIALLNPQTSADMLTHNGKVFVQKSQMGGGSPNLRGFEANKVLLVVDGVRMNNAIYRSGHLQSVLTIDPDIIERSEVLFGPGSVVYGSDALGGVMHFHTLSPKLSIQDRVQTKATLSSRLSSVNREKRIHAHIEIGGKKWASLTSLSLSDFDDLRVGQFRTRAFRGLGIRDSFVVRENGQDRIIANPDPNTQRPSGYKQLDFLQKMVFVPNQKTEHILNLQLSNSTDIPRFDRLTQLRDGRLRYAAWYYGPQSRLQASYQVHHVGQNILWDEFKGTFAYQHIRESRHTRNFQSDWLNHRREALDIGSVNVDFQKRLLGKVLLSYGIEGMLNDVQSTAESEDIVKGTLMPLDTRYPDGGSILRSIAGYATVLYNPKDQLSLKGGVRWTRVGLNSSLVDTSFYFFGMDEIEQRNQAFSGSLEMIYRPNKNWKLGFMAGTGFRAPNLDDVAKIFDSQPGNVVIPNENLKPEYTYNSEFSLGYKFGKFLSLESNTYFTFYDQAIVLRDAGEDSILYEGVLSNVQQNVNAQRAYLFGSSLGLLLRFSSFTFESTLNYTYGHVLDHGLVIPLDHIPPVFGKSQLTYRRKRLTLTVESFYQGWKRLDRFSPRDFNNLEFATEEGWPAWAVINIRSERKIGKSHFVRLGVENLMDLHYRSFSSRISAPGRNIYVAVQLNF